MHNAHETGVNSIMSSYKQAIFQKGVKDDRICTLQVLLVLNSRATPCIWLDLIPSYNPLGTVTILINSSKSLKLLSLPSRNQPHGASCRIFWIPSELTTAALPKYPPSAWGFQLTVLHGHLHYLRSEMHFCQVVARAQMSLKLLSSQTWDRS